MRRSLLLLSTLALVAACATPREACINNAQRELRVINGLIATTQANITRGYAVAEVDEVRMVRGTCRGRDEAGGVIEFSCEQPETSTRRVPQAIDLNVERAKLQSLLERKTQMERQTNAAIQQCIAANPE